MKQEIHLEDVVRQRLRSLRLARGWSLDDLARRSLLSPSTLSRLETGPRRLALDQLTALAAALDVTLDALVATHADEDVVIRPRVDERRGTTTWLLSRGGDRTVSKLMLTRPAPDRLNVHPGRDWFTVLSGTVELRLDERTIAVETGEAAEFSTLVPHAFGALGGPAEILCILDHAGERTHL